jgi:hypothetical protein
MSTKKKLIFSGLFLLAILSNNSFAAQTCDEQLHNLIVSNIPPDTTFPYTYRNDKSLVTDLNQHKDGLYDIYVKAKRYGLTVTIDTNKNVIYYGDQGSDPNKYWKAPPDSIKSFASQCLKEIVPGNLEYTDLPIEQEDNDNTGWRMCLGKAHAMNQCGSKFHEYKQNQLAPAIAKQVDASLSYFLELPPLSDLAVYLGTMDTQEGYEFVLYTFKGDTLITKETIGRKTNKVTLDFEIDKNYFVHQRLGTRVRQETESDSGMDFKELYKKLDTSGKLLKCAKLNVACK